MKQAYFCYNCKRAYDADPAQSAVGRPRCGNPFDDVRVDGYQIGGDHYKEMAVQPWAAMESWMTPEEFAGFLRGNVIKYVARAGKKGDEVQDLKKALHYLEKLVSVKEQEK